MKLRVLSFAGTVSITCSLLLSSSVGVVSAQDNSRPRYTNARRGDGWTVSESTIISVRMNTRLTSKTARVGDKFTATIAVPIYVNGETAVPAGSIVEGHVTQVTPAKRMNRSGNIAVDFDQLVLPNGSSVHLTGTLTSDDPYIRGRIDDENRVSGEKGKNPIVFVGGGGALGAILGGIKGGGSGAATGGAIGAGVGIATILMSKGQEAEVPAGTPFGIQLRQPLYVHNDNSGVQGPIAGSNTDPVDARQPAPRDHDRTVETSPRARGTAPDRTTDTGSRSRGAPPELRRGEPRPTTETAEANPSSADAPSADTPTADPEPAREVETPKEPDPPLSLSSPEAIRRAQAALKEQGYYEGQTDGVMSPRTSTALKTYQRERKLPESGELDEATARSLGVIGASAAAAGATRRNPETRPPSDAGKDRDAGKDNVVPANVLGATARRLADGSIYVSIDTQANTGGWRWFAEHKINGDTLELFAKGVRPTGMVTQSLTRGRIEVTVKEGVAHVQRVVVHSSTADRTLELNSGASSPTTNAGRDSTNISEAAALQRQAEDLLDEFQRITGVRLNSGSVQVDSGARQGNPEIELLFALDSFVKSTQLYFRVLPSLQDPARVREATLSMARQARVTDRVIATSTNRAATQLLPSWDQIRQHVLALMQSQGIAASEIEP